MSNSDALTLYVRPDCHLCEEMASNLNEFRLAFQTVNVDEDAHAAATYGDFVPVLSQGDAEIARAPQSARTLRRALQRAGVL